MRGSESTGSNVRKARGFELLRQVYDELYSQLGEEYSPTELLQAAQTLIDVTDEEYVSENAKVESHRSGYFSHETDRMLANRAWWVLENEQRNDGLGDDRLSFDIDSTCRLRVLYQPDAYVHRG